MSDTENAIERAMSIAQTYFDDYENLTTNELIDRLERVAYGAAREGNSSQAMVIFIAVANLERSKSNAGT